MRCSIHASITIQYNIENISNISIPILLNKDMSKGTVNHILSYSCQGSSSSIWYNPIKCNHIGVMKIWEDLCLSPEVFCLAKAISRVRFRWILFSFFFFSSKHFFPFYFNRNVFWQSYMKLYLKLKKHNKDSMQEISSYGLDFTCWRYLQP